MSTAYRNTWPARPLLLWRLRHAMAADSRFAATQRACVTCGGYYTPQHYRAHLRSEAHAQNRGWWR